MANNETLGLAEAVRLTLAYNDAAIFDDPQRFMAYLYEMTNDRSNEMRVLKNNCNAELLAPFRRAGSMSANDLKRAAAQVQLYLADECQINAETSRVIARGLAEGVARWREISLDWGGDATGAKGSRSTGASGGSRAGNTGSRTTKSTTPGPKRTSRLPALLAALLLCAVAAFAGWRLWGSLGGSSTGDADEGVWLKASSETVDDGEVIGTMSYTYDEHGNMLTAKWFDVLDDDEEATRTNTWGGYDRYGYASWQKSTWIRTEDDGDVAYQDKNSYTYSYELDWKGRVQTRTSECEWLSWYPSNGWEDEPDQIDETTTYTYDGDTIVRTEAQGSHVSGDYAWTSTTSYEYDQYGHQLEYQTYNESNYGVSYSYRSIATYDLADDGTPRKMTEQMTNKDVDSDGDVTTTLSTYQCVYDEHGNITESRDTVDGETTTTRYKNEYDENGNRVRQENLTDGSVTTYTYRYFEDPSLVVQHNYQ